MDVTSKVKSLPLYTDIHNKLEMDTKLNITRLPSSVMWALSQAGILSGHREKLHVCLLGQLQRSTSIRPDLENLGGLAFAAGDPALATEQQDS